jgi:homogentisate 1,2-dioxygenase
MYHRNIDYDEVFFTHSAGAGPRPEGILTLNPAGLHHGPLPGVIEASRANWTKDARLEFTAINIDTERPLEMTEAAMGLEIPDYYTKWIPESSAATL